MEAIGLPMCAEVGAVEPVLWVSAKRAQASFVFAEPHFGSLHGEQFMLSTPFVPPINGGSTASALQSVLPPTVSSSCGVARPGHQMDLRERASHGLLTIDGLHRAHRLLSADGAVVRRH